MSFVNKLGDDALKMIRNLPRLTLGNLRRNKGAKQFNERGRGNYGGRTHGCGQKGSKARQNYMPLGYETGNNPFYKRFPHEPYYRGIESRRQSLLQLQKFIDTNRIDPSKPIDLATLCNTGLYTFDPLLNHYGVHLTHEGAENFKAKLNIEVQWTTEPVIAAIERNGGTITTAFFDIHSLHALKNPSMFFSRGEPIPLRFKPPQDAILYYNVRFLFPGEPIPLRFKPPQDAILYYTSPENRGYLSDPDQVSWQRFALAQKYGYTLPAIEQDPDFEMLTRRKDPRQIFYGLEPGWVVNVIEKTIFKPKDEELIEYYKS
uniref:Large ribosomal subunit protein uL15m n=1 Tax=Cacopsylla melanoneura TaxID=428564 RepID=A0A8D8UT25_9HEMI